MFQPWRIKLREAELAVKAGRLDEARDMLSRGNLVEYLPGKRLMGELATKLLARATEASERGEGAAAWRDLGLASALGAGPLELATLRQHLTDQLVSEVIGNLRAGDLEAAQARLDELTRHHIETSEVRALRQVAGRVSTARKFSRAGQFLSAENELTAAAQLRPDLSFLGEQSAQYRARAASSRKLHTDLHAALSSEDWTRALTLAEELLAISPDDQPARAARRRAWEVVGTPMADSQVVQAELVSARHARSPRNGSPWNAGDGSPGERPGGKAGDRPVGKEGAPMSSSTRIQQDTATGNESGARCQLWVDAVGGYLVCLGDTVVLGQPAPGHHVDIPILGDLSSRHAIIHRVGEGYLLEPVRRVRVDGREIQQTVSLTDGAILELGEGVRLRYRRPHPLSATARLEFVSHHRTQPPVDGVLLMAESCVLGPAENSHVVCRRWTSELRLFRHGTALACRATGPEGKNTVEIDGQPCAGGGPLTLSSSVAGDDFALRLEQI